MHLRTKGMLQALERPGPGTHREPGSAWMASPGSGMSHTGLPHDCHASRGCPTFNCRPPAAASNTISPRNQRSSGSGPTPPSDSHVPTLPQIPSDPTRESKLPSNACQKQKVNHQDTSSRPDFRTMASPQQPAPGANPWRNDRFASLGLLSGSGGRHDQSSTHAPTACDNWQLFKEISFLQPPHRLSRMDLSYPEEAYIKELAEAAAVAGPTRQILPPPGCEDRQAGTGWRLDVVQYWKDEEFDLPYGTKTSQRHSKDETTDTVKTNVSRRRAARFRKSFMARVVFDPEHMRWILMRQKLRSDYGISKMGEDDLCVVLPFIDQHSLKDSAKVAWLAEAWLAGKASHSASQVIGPAAGPQ